MHFAALFLAARGHTVRFCGTPPTQNPFPTEEDYSWAEGWLLPLPLTRGERVTSPLPSPPTLAEIAAHAREGCLVLGGSIPPGFREWCEGAGAQVEDYYADPILTQENAALTAEGAIGEWMRLSDRGLGGGTCAVLGFGRIARHLCRLLSAWKVEVFVYARKEKDLAEAASCGYRGLPLSPQTVFREIDALFNTVPARIFSEACFANCGRTLIFDLADSIRSAPGAAGLYTLRGVPGRYAPRAAGEAIGRAVLRRLEGKSEEGRREA